MNSLDHQLDALARKGVRVWDGDATRPTGARAYLRGLVAGDRAPAVVSVLSLPRPTAWRLGEVDADFVAGAELTLSEGIVFGGYQAAVVDHVAGLAMMTALTDDYDFVTSRIETRFVAPLVPGPIALRSRLVEAGRRVATVEVELRQDGSAKTIASVEQVLVAKRPALSGAQR